MPRRLKRAERARQHQRVRNRERAAGNFSRAGPRARSGFSYQYRPGLGVTVDIANVFHEPLQFYMGNKDRFRQNITNFVTVAIGVNGRF